MLDEKGTVAALKQAYKGSGYKAAFVEGKLPLRCGVWAVEMDEESEHTRMTPGWI